MTPAPEDQNGLREALARVVAPRAWQAADELRDWPDSEYRRAHLMHCGPSLEVADRIIAGPLAPYLAAEAEITRLKEGMEALKAKAEGQLAYWRERQAAEKCLEEGLSEDGMTYTPMGDHAAWQGGYCNGRMSEADWWRWTLKELATLSPKEHPMAETQSAPSIPSEWGAAVAAKVARAIRDACGVEADKCSLAADEIDGACDEAVKAALQVLAEAFVIPGDVLAVPPTTLTESVASARTEGWQPIETAPKDHQPILIALDRGRYGDICRAPVIAFWSEAYLDWRHWHDRRPLEGSPTHWMPLPAPPTTPEAGPMVKGTGLTPAMVFSLAEILGDEMAARGWTIEDAGGRMGVDGPARDTLVLATMMGVQRDGLLLTDDFFDGLARAFDVSPQFFRNIHAQWLAHPAARQEYEVPDELFGPWLREALNPAGRAALAERGGAE